MTISLEYIYLISSFILTGTLVNKTQKFSFIHEQGGGVALKNKSAADPLQHAKRVSRILTFTKPKKRKHI